MKAIQSLFILVVTTVFFTSCDPSDSSEGGAPTVSYNPGTIQAVFFQPGATSPPDVNWNGNQGTFSTSHSIPGLSLNNTTGVLSWTKNLPLELFETIQITATNNAGVTSTPVTIDNSFEGDFTGLYDGTTYYELDFSRIGILHVRDESETTLYTYTGSWTIDGNTLMGDYWDETTGDKYSISGTLNIGTNVTYSGTWYYEYGAISGNEGGTVEMQLN